MFKKVKLSTLIIILIILFAAVIVMQRWDAMKGERNFKSTLTEVDTANVTAIYVNPKDKKTGESKFTKSGLNWQFTNQNKRYRANNEFVNEVLKIFAVLKSQRVAATEKSKWAEYELIDSMATHVKIEVKNEVVADLYIGKFTFSQGKNNPMMRQGGGSITSYIRLADDDIVYAVDGFLSMMFNRSVESFRYNTLISNTKEVWEKISFSYPADSSFSLTKTGEKWQINGTEGDSALIAQFINTLSNTTSSDFYNENVTLQTPSHKIKIEGKNLGIPIEINAYIADETNKYFITSNLNTEAKFSAKNGLFSKIFASKSKFSVQVPIVKK